jgi:hypothetical protein
LRARSQDSIPVNLPATRDKRELEPRSTLPIATTNRPVLHQVSECPGLGVWHGP